MGVGNTRKDQHNMTYLRVLDSSKSSTYLSLSGAVIHSTSIIACHATSRKVW